MDGMKVIGKRDVRRGDGRKACHRMRAEGRCGGRRGQKVRLGAELRRLLELTGVGERTFSAPRARTNEDYRASVEDEDARRVSRAYRGSPTSRASATRRSSWRRLSISSASRRSSRRPGEGAEGRDASRGRRDAARRSSRAQSPANPAPHSSPSPRLNSWKCSWAWARRAFAISSRRRRSRLRPSSSSTSWTRGRPRGAAVRATTNAIRR